MQELNKKVGRGQKGHQAVMLGKVSGGKAGVNRGENGSYRSTGRGRHVSLLVYSATQNVPAYVLNVVLHSFSRRGKEGLFK